MIAKLFADDELKRMSFDYFFNNLSTSETNYLRDQQNLLSRDDLQEFHQHNVIEQRLLFVFICRYTSFVHEIIIIQYLSAQLSYCTLNYCIYTIADASWRYKVYHLATTVDSLMI